MYPAPTDLNLHTHIVIVNIPRRLHSLDSYTFLLYITSAHKVISASRLVKFDYRSVGPNGGIRFLKTF